MDFTWVTTDDSNAIQNAIMDAKGDLIGATAADTPARLAVGTNGQVLTADSTASTGIKWATPAASVSGLTLITTASPSSSSSTSVNSCFSSTYQSYQVHYNLSATAAASMIFKLRASGTDATTNYISENVTYRGATVDANRALVDGNWFTGVVRASGRSYGIINISNPFASAETSFTHVGQDPVDGAGIAFNVGSNSNATSYDGFTISVGTGNFTGSIRIYGVQNS
jgi:hypothetical protein